MTDELNALAAEAAAVDAATQPVELAAPEAVQAEPEPAAPVLDPMVEANEIINLIAWGVEQLFPMLGYKEETKAEGAKRLAPLLVKYNLRDTLMGQWGAEIQAGMFFGGVLFASVQVVRAAKDEALQAEHKKSWFAKFFKWAK